jgi:molybdopterin molybdotransferase
MLSLKEAQKKVLQSTADLKEKRVPLLKSLHSIIAEDIFSNIDSPAQDITLVSGYALRAEDVIGADENYPVKLSLLKTDESNVLSITPGYCIKIRAGESIPEGVTSIASSAETESDGKDVFIFREYKVGENIKKKGSDLKIDDLIIPKGKTILSKEALLLSIIGKEKIKVYKKPRTSILPLIQDQAKKTIMENMLVSKTIESGAESTVIDLQIRDTIEKEIHDFMEKKSEKFDIVSFILKRDEIEKQDILKILERAGAKTIFTHINQDPAKDISFLKYRSTMVFVLFENLFEIDIYFEMFLKPIIQKMTGSNEMFSNILWAKPQDIIVHDKGKTTFLRVRIEKRSNEYFAKIIDPKEDNLFHIYKTDGIAMISEDAVHIGPDARIKVYLTKKLHN